MTTEKSLKRLGVFAIFLAGCLWGTIGIFIHALSDLGLSSVDIAFLRSLCACLLFAVYLLLFRRAAFRVKWRDIWCFLGTGVASIAFFNFCYFATIEATSMAVAAILLYTSPVFVLLLSLPLFGERITPRKGVAILLVVVGCALVSGVMGGISLGVPSLLLGLGAGFGYALYSIFGRFAISRGYRTDTINFYSFLFASIALFPLTEPQKLQIAVTSGASAIFFAAALALVATLLPYVLYTFGLSRVENGIAAIVAGIEPVVAALVGVLFLHEQAPDLPTLVGILLVLLAIVLPNLPQKRKDGNV